jgi:hypothetical protein
MVLDGDSGRNNQQRVRDETTILNCIFYEREFTVLRFYVELRTYNIVGPITTPGELCTASYVPLRTALLWFALV